MKSLLQGEVRVKAVARQVGLDAWTIYKYRATLLANEQRLPANGIGDEVGEQAGAAAQAEV